MLRVYVIIGFAAILFILNLIMIKKKYIANSKITNNSFKFLILLIATIVSVISAFIAIGDGMTGKNMLDYASTFNSKSIAPSLRERFDQATGEAIKSLIVGYVSIFIASFSFYSIERELKKESEGRKLWNWENLK